MITAAIAFPRTKAGMTSVARLRDRLSAGETKPEAGNRPNSTENSKISRIPSQKFGIDNPHSAAIVAA